MGRRSIYIVQSGDPDGDRVVYENVAAYPTRVQAQRAVTKAQREGEYEHQYDRVEAVPIDPPRLR